MLVLFFCAYLNSNIRILVSAGRNESWLYNAGADEVIVCHPNTPNCPKESANALDGQSLISFAASNYERLENTRVVFVHGGRNEWHQFGNIHDIVQMAWD